MPQVERPLLRVFHNSRDGLLKSPSRAAPMRIATCATQAHHQGEQYRPYCSFPSLSLRHGCTASGAISIRLRMAAQLAPDRIRLLIYFAVRRALAGKRDRAHLSATHSACRQPMLRGCCGVASMCSLCNSAGTCSRKGCVCLGRDSTAGVCRHIETLLVRTGAATEAWALRRGCTAAYQDLRLGRSAHRNSPPFCPIGSASRYRPVLGS